MNTLYIARTTADLPEQALSVLSHTWAVAAEFGPSTRLVSRSSQRILLMVAVGKLEVR
jgi:hypothetical protein